MLTKPQISSEADMRKITFSFIIILVLIAIPSGIGIGIADSYAVRAVTKPDLTVQDITWSPVEPSKGDNVTFSVNIKNQGGTKAISCRVYFYVDGHFKSYQYMPSLAPGDLVTESFTWVAEAGTHTIKVIADGENWIKESDEDNNTKTVTIQTIPPDLIIQAITWSPENISEGDNVTFTVNIRNQGGGKADYSYVAYYVDDLYLTSANVMPLAPGATDNKTFCWDAEAGAHTIKVVADPYNKVTESNEQNNEKSVVFPTLSPDLIVSSIIWSPLDPPAGVTANFTVTIRNQGISGADHSTIHYYIGDHVSGNQYVPSIAAGALVTSTFTWKARAGLHVIKVVVDPYNDVIEVNEDNNEKVVNFGGALPSDLIVQNMTWAPENPQEGDELTLTVSIKNQGSGQADYSYVAYYVDDLYLGSDHVIPLDPGATYNRTFTWMVQAGSHVIRAVADGENRILESDENNNEKKVIYPLPPDLIIQAITWSAENISEGDNVTFIVKIKNQGSGQADYSYVAYYVEDLYLGSAHVMPLDPGATDNKTFFWVAEAGTHTIKVVADPDNKVMESDETNNEGSVAFPWVAISSPVWSTVKPTAPTETTPAVKPNQNASSEKESGSYWWVFFMPIPFLVSAVFLFISLRSRPG